MNDQTLSCGHPIQAASEMLPDFIGDTPATQKVGTVYCRWCEEVARAKQRIAELEEQISARDDIYAKAEDDYAQKIVALEQERDEIQREARGLCDTLNAYDGSGIPQSDASDAFSFLRKIAARAAGEEEK